MTIMNGLALLCFLVHAFIGREVLATSHVDSRFFWRGTPTQAETSLGQKQMYDGINTIYATNDPNIPLPSNWTEFGTQLLYTVLVKDSQAVPLVDVTLVSAAGGREIHLLQYFDLVSQRCSCFYLDANDLTSKYNLESELYAIRFKSPPDASILQNGTMIAPIDSASGWIRIITGIGSSTLPAVTTAVDQVVSTTSTSTWTTSTTIAVATPLPLSNAPSAAESSRQKQMHNESVTLLLLWLLLLL